MSNQRLVNIVDKQQRHIAFAYEGRKVADHTVRALRELLYKFGKLSLALYYMDRAGECGLREHRDTSEIAAIVGYWAAMVDKKDKKWLSQRSTEQKKIHEWVRKLRNEEIAHYAKAAKKANVRVGSTRWILPDGDHDFLQFESGDWFQSMVAPVLGAHEHEELAGLIRVALKWTSSRIEQEIRGIAIQSGFPEGEGTFVTSSDQQLGGKQLVIDFDNPSDVLGVLPTLFGLTNR